MSRPELPAFRARAILILALAVAAASAGITTVVAWREVTSRGALHVPAGTGSDEQELLGEPPEAPTHSDPTEGAYAH